MTRIIDAYEFYQFNHFMDINIKFFTGVTHDMLVWGENKPQKVYQRDGMIGGVDEFGTRLYLQAYLSDGISCAVLCEMPTRWKLKSFWIHAKTWLTIV